MENATLSTKGQLVIPSRIRKALHLRSGDKVSFRLDGEKVILQREEPPAAKVVKGRFGRPVLKAPPGAPEMTPGLIRELMDETL